MVRAFQTDYRETGGNFIGFIFLWCCWATLNNEDYMKRVVLLLLSVFAVPNILLAACPYDPDCLSNPYGAGSPYKPDGLMNPYSEYGSPYSNKSWTNPYATDAPKIYDEQGNYHGKLSANPYDPDSTSNPYGRYGNPYSSESLNNSYGAGNPYSSKKLYVVPSQ